MHRLEAAFPFPNPRIWPAEAVERFRRATEPRTLMDVFAFRRSNHEGAFFMEDALTAVRFLPIQRDEWSTDHGYPCVAFDWSRLEEYTGKLAAAGYQLWVLEKTAQTPKTPAKVISISSARSATTQRRHKWA